MTITVLDTYPAMKEILRAPVGQRHDLVRAMMAPAEGGYHRFPGEVDLVQMHQFGSGFPLDRDEDRCLEGLEALRAANAWERIQVALERALAVQTDAIPAVRPFDITVLVVLGDPGSTHFMDTTLGMVANGSVSGYIYLIVWPYPQNLDRLEATAVHELHHNLRFSPGAVVWDPDTVTVGEHVVSEGLADAFARQLYGDELGYTRIGVPHLHDDEVFERVVSGLEVTGMENFTAWVHGDEFAKLFGVTPVGLPTGAGYAVGNRLVDAYLEANGQAATEALLAPSREVIDTALDALR